MMQPSPVATPAIDAQQQQQQQLMMMPLPPEAGFLSQQPQPQLMVQQYPKQVIFPQQPQPQIMVQQYPPQPQIMVQQYPQQVSPADEIKTLWIGGLQYWMDETYLSRHCFAYIQDLLSLKIIRNKQTGQSKGYGFLEFASHAAAQMALQNYSGLQMPMAEQSYRLNWATFGIGEKRPGDYTIFVGDLASDVTADLLQETFRDIYPSVKGAKVIIDRTTGSSKGYGFVNFGDENEQARAMTEMNGMLCSSRRMRIGPAITKKTTVYQQPYPKVVASGSENDPNNTTLFVGGLDPTVTFEMLTQSFVQFGELVFVKVPVGKRCGFVQFSNRASAEVALQMLHGTVLGQQPIRLSWGRNPANKQVQSSGWLQIQQPDPNQWHGDVQGYNAGYGYVTQPPDPNMYSYTPPNANSRDCYMHSYIPPNETYLSRDCFAYTQDLLSLNIIRNKQTRQSKSYGFLEFASHAAAQIALQNYNGLQMPMAEQSYRLNWATFGIGEKRPEDYTIFVGDLAFDVTADLLQETFRDIYPSVKGAKVIIDRTTGCSKGYGFVNFGDENEQARAMTEMNGMLCSSRRMRTGPAITKKTTIYQQPYPKVVASAIYQQPYPTDLGQQQQPIRLSCGQNPANKQVQSERWLQIQQPDPMNSDVKQPQDPNIYNYALPNANYQQQDPNMYSYTPPNANYQHQYPNMYNYANYQQEDPNMYSYTPPNVNYQQQYPNMYNYANYQQQDPNMYSYTSPNANYQQQDPNMYSDIPPNTN